MKNKYVRMRNCYKLIRNLASWCGSSAFFFGKYGLCSGSAFKLYKKLKYASQNHKANISLRIPLLTDSNFALRHNSHCTTSRTWTPSDWKSFRSCTETWRPVRLRAHRGTHGTLGSRSPRSRTCPALPARRHNGNRCAAPRAISDNRRPAFPGSCWSPDPSLCAPFSVRLRRNAVQIRSVRRIAAAARPDIVDSVRRCSAAVQLFDIIQV